MFLSTKRNDRADLPFMPVYRHGDVFELIQPLRYLGLAEALGMLRPSARAATEAALREGWLDGVEELPDGSFRIEATAWAAFRRRVDFVAAGLAAGHSLIALLAVPSPPTRFVG